MSATVTLYQQRSALGPTGYRVTNQITASTEIPTEVFVYQVADSLFSHVADMNDFQYPATLAAAQTAGVLYYRQDSAVRTYPDVSTALAFASLVKKRVQALLETFNAEVLTFPGNDTTVYP